MHCSRIISGEIKLTFAIFELDHLPTTLGKGFTLSYHS